jgi:hypothetical protein
MLLPAFDYWIFGGGPADLTNVGREPPGGFAFLFSPLLAPAPALLLFWAFFIPGNFKASIASLSLSYKQLLYTPRAITYQLFFNGWNRIKWLSKSPSFINPLLLAIH